MIRIGERGSVTLSVLRVIWEANYVQIACGLFLGRGDFPLRRPRETLKGVEASG